MTIKELLKECAAYVPISICKTTFFAEGDTYEIVFEGLESEIRKFDYWDCDIDYFTVSNNQLIINFSVCK